ncbi:hypothetical protein [Streptomyces deccanensis]|uniref:hypothetical protein n=1 Tax=Streptomyces deccanensis TaxID=424188 RepID=UPI001EFB03E4|nr:hypothetical protein [Streptomyces deccanensis]ULR50590.1 hypothetical protein L3078_15485 [Streptomyces deccanensis]
MSTTSTTDLTPAQAREALAAAEKEKGEAQGLADALAERARDGDPDVTPAKLAEARQLADFAELRITAAERKLTAAEAADRAARAEQLAADARQLVTDDDHGPLAEAIRDAAAAVNALIDVAQARSNRIRSINQRIRALEGEFEQVGAPGDLALHHGVARHPEGTIVTGQPMVTLLSAAELVAAAVRLATGQDKLSEGELSQAFDGPDATLGRVMKAMPSLAEEWRHSPEEWACMGRSAQAHALSTRRAPVGVKAPDPASAHPHHATREGR